MPFVHVSGSHTVWGSKLCIGTRSPIPAQRSRCAYIAPGPRGQAGLGADCALAPITPSALGLAKPKASVLGVYGGNGAHLALPR